MSTLFDVDEVPVASGKSNEWFTPHSYIEAARAVMGAIDLDPASCELANQTVQAGKYYTKEQDGLAQEWQGCVWLNPPFGRVQPELKGSTRSWQVYFMQVLLKKYHNREIDQAVALLFGTSACMPWFQSFWQFPICIAKSRINFLRPDGKIEHFGYGNLFVYLGPNEQKFTEVFSKFGRIVKAIDTPRQPSIQPTLWDKEITS